jgi:outer membrane protein assembly factor BamB
VGFTAGNCIALATPAIGSGGAVYFGSMDNKLHALHPNGIEAWSFTTAGYVDVMPTLGADETVYVGSYDSKLYALDGWSGTKKWELATGSPVVTSAAIGANGLLYLGTRDGLLAVGP